MKNLLGEAKTLMQIAWPILVAQIAQTLMGFVDTVMAGQVSAVDVAAVALGNSVWLPTIIVVGGTIMAVPAMVARKHGAKQENAIRPLIHQTIYMAALCSIVVIAIMSNASLGLKVMQVDPGLVQTTSSYLNALMWGAPAFLLFQSLRCFTEGMSVTKPSMVIGFIGFFVNIPANYVFIYGHLGMPALGGVGSGVATAIVYWSMAISLVVYIVFAKRFERFKLFSHFGRFDVAIQRQLLTTGMPIALAVFLEVAVFAFIAMMLAPLGSIVVASNQIAVNFTMISLMIPLSIGAAVTIRVGYYLGLNESDRARRIVSVGVLTASLISGVVMLLILLFKGSIASLYTTDQDVIGLATALLLWGALFQVPNAIQTIYVAALRGYKDTIPILFVAFVSYWLVGISLGYVLAKTDLIVSRMGASGFWLGFIVGLVFAGFALRNRITRTSKDNVELSAI
ncbi:MATE family efflux transporter [Vibrio gigantis]|uniref:MATE family efflux transporter n=1 Tax=Vibrio gigantis TaxID=296199 RepID=UPI003D1511A0